MALNAAVGGASMAILAALILLSIGSLVCWIMVLIHIFKENVGLGVLGIFCGLFAFIYGWVKVGEYGIQKVMLAWTLCFAGSIVLQIINVAVIAAAAASGAGG